VNLISSFKAVKYNHVQQEEVEDILTNESALQILVNDAPFSVTMRTPGSEKDLVRGLLFAENVYEKINSVFRYTAQQLDEFGNPSVVNVILSESELAPGFNSKRNLTSVSSCGICGKEDLSAIELCGDALNDEVVITSQQIGQMFEKMAEVQHAFLHSGGSHAAAAFDSKNDMLSLKEDIGRHNAVDKVIGQLLNENRLNDAKVILVSGRVSFEIVSKAHRAKIPILAAISAPSSLAVTTSRHFGITLLGFCRDDHLTAYSNSQRITLK
jgi:FdhD protein